jgi:hypothetical protein
MRSLSRVAAVALAAAFALTAFEVPTEAREAGVTKVRHVKKTKTHRRVAQRAVPYAAAAAPATAYAAPHPMAPYGGPGRAQFEPLIPGAPPERGDNHSPEGP